MVICAVINESGELVNTIIAAPTDLPPDGCKLVEIPEGYFWNGSAVAPIEVSDGN